tara:strand:+ start:4645 stop:5136 length:492 start_codon:yes stop_codon:yes gene_type:complete
MTKDIATILDEAVRTAKAAEAAELQLCDALQAALRTRMPIGLVINITPVHGLAEHLHATRTIKGADRGTKVFRIESAPSVEVNPRHPAHATWTCRATPISERTGKDMSGATHGRDARITVTLKGAIFSAHLPPAACPKEHAAGERQRILDFIKSTKSPKELAA